MPGPYVQSLNGPVPLVLPPSWTILTVAAFQEHRVRETAVTLAKRAMRQPIGAPPLENQLFPGDKVSIIVEDLTRASPKKIILKMLLESLSAMGIRRKDISIVIALGTHRPLSASDLEKAFGRETVTTYAFYNHDCRAEDLVAVGQLASGITVKINKRVAEADYRIGIGSIFPHPLNGFGGGGKILFPGVADFDSIYRHHLQHSFRGGAFLGNIEGNAFYEEVTAMARAGRLDFIINSVLDHNDRLHEVVCGNPVHAHRTGADICRRIISQPFNGLSDVTIISAFPYAEGPQIMKPLAPANMITRPGGCVILAADCRSPLPGCYFEACEQFRAEHAGRLRQKVLEAFGSNRPILRDASPELNMSMAQVMLALDNHDVILVTDGMSPDQVERLGFAAAADLDDAIARCTDRYGRPTANIVPSGGAILPVLPASLPTGC